MHTGSQESPFLGASHSGETVYKCETVSTPLGKNPGKRQAEKLPQQPSTQSGLESRLTGQTPGTERELLRKAAKYFPAQGTTCQHNPGFQSVRRKVQKDDGLLAFKQGHFSLTSLGLNLFKWIAQASENMMPTRKTKRVEVIQGALTAARMAALPLQCHFPVRTLPSDYPRVKMTNGALSI